MASEFKSVQPLDYYRRFIEEGIRPDGRGMDKFRPTFLNLGSISTANGSCMVRCGSTVVLCGVKGELANPEPTEPNKGFIVANVELPPLCSSKYKPGPPSESSQVYAQLINDILQNSSCIKREDLCLVKDKLCWCLYVDLTCLDYDGNVLDACILALVSALERTSLPEVQIENDIIQVKKQQIPLKVNCRPLSSTFAVFDNVIIADPSSEEEDHVSGLITLICQGGSVTNILKPGGTALNDEQLQICMSQAKARYRDLIELIGAALDTNSEA